MTKPNLVFVCVKNGGKSQMAAAVARQLGGDAVSVSSAGTHPGSKLNEASRQAVEARGGSFEGEYPKELSAQMMAGATHIIMVGSQAQLPAGAPTQAHVRVWDTDEPSIRGIEGEERMNLILDDITARVRELYRELGVSTSG